MVIALSEHVTPRSLVESHGEADMSSSDEQKLCARYSDILSTRKKESMTLLKSAAVTMSSFARRQSDQLATTGKVVFLR